MDVGDDPLGDKVDGQLVVTGAQGTAFFEPTHHALDDVPLAVGRFVEARFPRLVLARWDHRFDVVTPQPRADARIAVAFVRGDLGRPTRPTRTPRSLSAAHHVRERLRLVPLSGRHDDGQEQATAGAYQVDLGAEATLRPAQRMVLRLRRLRRFRTVLLRRAVRIFFSPRRQLGWPG
jgi:hypothetical protein